MQIFASIFLHEYLAQLAQENSVEQLLACSKTYPNFRPNAPLLHGTGYAPTCSLLMEAGDDRNPCCNPNYTWNLAILSAQNPFRHASTIFPRSLGPSHLFWHLQLQKWRPQMQETRQ